MQQALADRLEGHEREHELVIRPDEIVLGLHGRQVIRQLLHPEQHTQDELNPTRLLQHFCREAQPGQKEGKPVACPELAVGLGPQRVLILQHACRDCALKFACNMERST